MRLPAVTSRTLQGDMSRPRSARPALTAAAAVAILAATAWFTLPTGFGSYNEGFQSTIAINAHEIAVGDLAHADLLYPLNGAFFVVSRFGVALVLAGLIAIDHFDALINFRLLLGLSLVGLIAANTMLLWRRYRVGLPWSLLPALLFPAVFETAWFFNDDLLSAALSTAALAVFWLNLTLPATAVAAVLFALAISARTDAVLMTPAFAALLWFDVKTWRERAMHVLVAAPIVALLPIGLYAAWGLSIFDVVPLTRRATTLWARGSGLRHMGQPILKAFAPPGALAVALGVLSTCARRQWREIILLIGVPAVFVLAYGTMLSEVRYLLPLFPIFSILMVEGARATMRAGARWRNRGIAAFALAFASCLLPPVLPPLKALHFVATDHDTPRPLIGRLWSPAISIWWNRKLNDGVAVLGSTLATAGAGGTPAVVVSTYWNSDRLIDLLLLEQGFTGQRMAAPAACGEIGEVFTRGAQRVVHLRPHIPMIPGERTGVTWPALGVPCMEALGVTGDVLLVDWTPLDKVPADPGPQPGERRLYYPKVDDIASLARPLASTVSVYTISEVPVGDVESRLQSASDTAEQSAAEQAIARRGEFGL